MKRTSALALLSVAALGLSASDIADLIEAEGDHHDAP